MGSLFVRFSLMPALARKFSLSWKEIFLHENIRFMPQCFKLVRAESGVG